MDRNVASIAHQRLILSLLITVTRELPQPNSNQEFRPEFYLNYMKQHKSHWKRLAESTGPEYARNLYWEPTSTECELVSKQYLDCTDFQGRVFRVSYSYALWTHCYGSIMCKSRGGNGCGVWEKYKNPCGSSVRRFFLPIAQGIWNKFTFPILKMIGDPSVKGKIRSLY